MRFTGAVANVCPAHAGTLPLRRGRVAWCVGRIAAHAAAVRVGEWVNPSPARVPWPSAAQPWSCVLGASPGAHGAVGTSEAPTGSACVEQWRTRSASSQAGVRRAGGAARALIPPADNGGDPGTATARRVRPRTESRRTTDGACGAPRCDRERDVGLATPISPPARGHTQPVWEGVDLATNPTVSVT